MNTMAVDIDNKIGLILLKNKNIFVNKWIVKLCLKMAYRIELTI